MCCKRFLSSMTWEREGRIASFQGIPGLPLLCSYKQCTRVLNPKVWRWSMKWAWSCSNHSLYAILWGWFSIWTSDLLRWDWLRSINEAFQTMASQNRSKQRFPQEEIGAVKFYGMRWAMFEIIKLGDCEWEDEENEDEDEVAMVWGRRWWTMPVNKGCTWVAFGLLEWF